MDFEFEHYSIKIVESRNHPGNFIAAIEELFNVADMIETPSEATEKLKPLFEKEIAR